MASAGQTSIRLALWVPMQGSAITRVTGFSLIWMAVSGVLGTVYFIHQGAG